MSERIVAIALLTERELERISGSISHCYPVVDDGIFDHLLEQLDNLEVEPLGQSIVLRVDRGK